MPSHQADDASVSRLTVLGPVGTAGEGRLTEFYAYPENLQSCWVRGNMIASLDGGATSDGKAGGLAGPGDRALFALMRQAADVILVGAATVRIENYSGAQLSVSARQDRQRRGQDEVPPIAVVTRSGNLAPTARLFTRTEVPPLIITTSRFHDDAERRLGSVAEVIDASGSEPDSVDSATVMKILSDRGLFRVLTEGGPLLLGTLITDRLLDELCLTVAPILVGGSSKRIVTGLGDVHTTMRRTHLLTDDDGYLYSRYVRVN